MAYGQVETRADTLRHSPTVLPVCGAGRDEGNGASRWVHTIGDLHTPGSLPGEKGHYRHFQAGLV